MARTLKERLFRGGLWIVAGKITAIACSFVLNLVLARALPPAEYGAYFIVLNTVIILATVGTLGMDQVVVRFVAMRVADGDRAGVRRVIGHCLRAVLLGALATSAAFYLLAPWFFNHMIGMPTVLPSIGLVIGWLLFATLQRQLAETFRGLRDFHFSTLFSGYRNNGILISLTGCIAMLVLWMFDNLTLRTTLAASAASTLAVVIVALVILRRRAAAELAPESPPAVPAQWSTLIALSESWPLWLATLLVVLRVQGNSWLAAIFDIPEHVALFGVAQRFVLLLTAPFIIVNLLLAPVVAELHQRGDLKRLERVVQVMGGLASLPGILILIALLLAGRPMLGLLFGSYYEAAEPILIALGVGQCANIATGSWQIVLPMAGQKYQMLKLSAIGLLLLLVFGVTGGYYAGVFGIAIGASAATVAINLLGMRTVRRMLGIWTFISIRRSAVMDTMSMLRGLRVGKARLSQ